VLSLFKIIKELTKESYVVVFLNINSGSDTRVFHEFIFEVTKIKIVINKYS